MSVQFDLSGQVLQVDDATDPVEAIVHKYDAFLNLIADDRFFFQKEAAHALLRVFASEKYPDLESLARDNWNRSQTIRDRYPNVDAFLARMPLKNRASLSVDLATGTGKSFLMYAIAAIALAEGMVDRVLVLCPSVTIEDELLKKFTRLAGNPELAEVMTELGAVVAIPGVRRGNETIQAGDICIENVHAVYEATGSSIRDSFRGSGARSLVLNDEAHHLFSPPDAALKKWMEFLLSDEFGFHKIVNVTGTAYTGDDYFPDVVYRYGIKSAIEAQIVKKPNYKIEETYTAHDWQKTYAIHLRNRVEYGEILKPLSIVVTQEIARCVEVWRELVDFLVGEEGISQAEAERKAIWVTSGVPSSGSPKARVQAAFCPRDDRDTPEKRRVENLQSLQHVDSSTSPVEWIVSVSMLTEGWDVKNVFQVVPHDSRAFSSKLLIAQVLGRGLRVPPGLPSQPLLTINNHEAWSGEIADLLKEVLEVENTLTWGFDPERAQYAIPLYNLRYEPEQKTVEIKRQKARAPEVEFLPQDRSTVEELVFSETGRLAVEISHSNLVEVDDAVKMIRLFLREKDATLAADWPAARIRAMIVAALRSAGQDETFLSKPNLTRLQQGFGPMLRGLDTEHPRLGVAAQELVQVDPTSVARQSFSESALKSHGAVWHVADDPDPFPGSEANLWNQYEQLVKMVDEFGDLASEDAKQIAPRIHSVAAERFKSPWNVHYVSHEPERKFSDLLFANAALFDAFVKNPDVGFYAFPYSYKPANTGKTHVANESFNPDFFIKLAGAAEVLVVEIKSEGDDSNRNRAKYRDGQKHFESLNERLVEHGHAWRYHFYFLSPEDYTSFMQQVRDGSYSGWHSSLMQSLSPRSVAGSPGIANG